MPYTIPANIRYEEKLVAGITIKQAVYIGICGGCIMFTWFRLDLPDIIKGMIATIFVLIAVGLVFFHMDEYAREYIGFVRLRKASWLSSVAQSFFGIKSIDMNTVFLKNGSTLAVISIVPINFGILDKEDQDAVIYGFREFLNSLSFSIQIVMRSVNLNLNPYLRHLRREIVRRDDKIAMNYYEQFSGFITKYLNENKINDRLFYIIIPGKPGGGLKDQLKSMDSRTKIVVDSLAVSGVVAKRLNTQQLINFYSSYFTEGFEVSGEYLFPVTMYKKMGRGRGRFDRKKETIDPKAWFEGTGKEAA